MSSNVFCTADDIDTNVTLVIIICVELYLSLDVRRVVAKHLFEVQNVFMGRMP